MARALALVLLAAFVTASGADARVPRSLDELPPDQYAIDGLAGVRVIAEPFQVPCSENPRIVVGTRFTRAARRVRYARALSVSPSGRVLSSRRFENSRRWRFAMLPLTRGCGVLHELHYSFHRPGDRSGQRLVNHLCVLGPNGERCPIPDEGE